MALIKDGYWQDTYWPSRYWQEDYWPEHGAPAPPPAPAEAVGVFRRRKPKRTFPLTDNDLALLKLYLEVKLGEQA